MADFLCDMTETLTDYKEIISGVLKEIEELKAAYSKLNEEYSSLRRLYQCTAYELKKTKKQLEQANKLLEKHGIKRPEKTSKNSSTPPSKESIHASATRRTKSIRKPSGLNQGGQKGHEGSTLMATEEPSETEDAEPVVCDKCGADLSGAKKVLVRTVMKLCIPASKPYIKRINYYQAICPECGELVQAPGFRGLSGNPVVYDERIKSQAVYLSVTKSLPFNRIQSIFEDMYDIHISQGTLVNWINEASEKAEPAVQEIINRIKASKVVGFDETGCYCNKKLRWAWIAQDKLHTYVFLGKSRRVKELEKVFGDEMSHMTAVTDRHSSYFSYQFEGHQICMAHLLREFQYLSDLNPKQLWSGKFATIIRDAINTRNSNREAVIDIGPWLSRLDRLLYEDVTKLGEKFTTLQKGLRKYRDYIFPFLRDPRIPPTNNDSERGFRIVKIKMHNSMCFRSKEGAEAYFRLHSIVETAKKHGRSAYDAILALFGVEAMPLYA